MDRDRLLLGLAAVFAGLTTLLVVGALATQPFLLAVAVPFGATTYLLWYHATGRLEERARERANARSGGTGAGPRFGASDPRSRFSRGARRAGTSAGASAGASAGGGAGGRATRRSASGPSRGEAYRTLGVDPGADDDAIRRAYRERVKDVHPDTERGDEESFKRVNRAYERLTEE